MFARFLGKIICIQRKTPPGKSSHCLFSLLNGVFPFVFLGRKYGGPLKKGSTTSHFPWKMRYCMACSADAGRSLICELPACLETQELASHSMWVDEKCSSRGGLTRRGGLSGVISLISSCELIEVNCTQPMAKL